MKSFLFTFVLAFTTPLASAELAVKVDQLQLVDGLRQLKESGEPFSGMAVDYYGNGQKRIQIDFRNGKKQGKEVAWYKDGQLKYVVRYRSGEPQALGSSWYAKQPVEKIEQGFLRCEDTQTLAMNCAQTVDSENDATSARASSCERYKALLEVCELLAEDTTPTKNSSLVFCNGQADLKEVCGPEEDALGQQNVKFVFCDDSPEMSAVCGK